MDIVLIDTIGFINNLPHEMIDPFISTLEHIKYADILIHVRDISHPMTDVQNETVKKVMKKMDMEGLLNSENFIEIWNKVDLHLLNNTNMKLEELENNEKVLYFSAT